MRATPDFTAADLESVSFAPEEVAGMEYQPQRSGAGAFTRGDENREIAERLEGLGLEANFVSQFFATSRRSELGFVESVPSCSRTRGQRRRRSTRSRRSTSTSSIAPRRSMHRRI
jgi:hypothetical protein